jgi:hypothetical protein
MQHDIYGRYFACLSGWLNNHAPSLLTTPSIRHCSGEVTRLNQATGDDAKERIRAEICTFLKLGICTYGRGDYYAAYIALPMCHTSQNTNKVIYHIMTIPAPTLSGVESFEIYGASKTKLVYPMDVSVGHTGKHYNLYSPEDYINYLRALNADIADKLVTPATIGDVFTKSAMVLVRAVKGD